MAYSGDNDILKSNKDYQDMIHSLAVLEAQKIQAIKDLEALEQLQLQLEQDPCEVYKTICREKISEECVLPCQQIVTMVPQIDWTQYNVQNTSANYNTRKKKCPNEDGTQSKRKKDQNGVSHGQPWTEEEQERLEELLKIYPSEEVEAKRWQKIATALGNRTTKQVCCRVQKYFIKLAKAGLTVPGRMPNLATYSKKSRIKRSSTRQPSLFFNSLKPKVYMTQETQQDIDSSSSDNGDDNNNDEDDDDTDTPILSPAPSSESPKCAGCHSNLESIYWSCNDCNGRHVVLCLACVKSNWSDGSHLPSHDMTELLQYAHAQSSAHSQSSAHTQSTAHSQLPSPYIDNDYTVFQQASTTSHYNYLDPNFCPAV